MSRRTRALLRFGHVACAALAFATWRTGGAPAPARAAAPPERWRIETARSHGLIVRDLVAGTTRTAPNPLPRLAPDRLAPGFNPNYWALADAHRVKVLSVETGEAVASFEAPRGGVDRLVWLDEDRLAVVPRAGGYWLVHRVSTGRQFRR